MKKQINEIKRMQLLAGIITESQLNENKKPTYISKVDWYYINDDSDYPGPKGRVVPDAKGFDNPSKYKGTEKSFLSENKLSYRDLKLGTVYRCDVKIQQGLMKGRNFTTDQEFIGSDKHNLLFKIVKIHTPETAEYLGKKIGDRVSTGEGAIPHDYTQIN